MSECPPADRDHVALTSHCGDGRTAGFTRLWALPGAEMSSEDEGYGAGLPGVKSWVCCWPEP